MHSSPSDPSSPESPYRPLPPSTFFTPQYSQAGGYYPPPQSMFDGRMSMVPCGDVFGSQGVGGGEEQWGAHPGYDQMA